MSLKLTPQFIEKTHRSCIKPISYFPKYRREKDEYIKLFADYKERYDASLDVTISHDELVNKIGLSTLFQTNFFRLFFRYCTGV